MRGSSRSLRTHRALVRLDPRAMPSRPRAEEERTAWPTSSRYARNPDVRAAARIRRAGQRQEGRFRRAQRRAPRPTSPASGRSSRARRCCGTSRSRRSLDESNAPFYKWFEDGELNVSYNCLDRNLAERQRRQGRDHLRGRRRHGDEGHLPGALSPRLPPRERPEVARHQEGRPRPHLHADVDRGRGRDAGLRAHRRDAFGRVRRLLGEVAAGAHHRRRRGRGDHRRRAGARRQAAAAQGDRRRSARHGRLRGHPQRRSSTGAPAATSRSRRRATSGCTSSSRSRPTPASRSGSAPSIRCSSSTRRARPASRRACSTAPAATCCGRC